MSIEWQTIAEDFASDGALRDIYVFQTSASDWQHALEVVRLMATDIQYRGGEQLLPLPSSFGDTSEFGRLLTFRIGNLELACHFFHDAAIEFDFWPSNLTGQTDLNDLLHFIQHLGASVGKPVIVCPENSPDYAFLRYDPQSQLSSYVQIQHPKQSSQPHTSPTP